MPRILTRYRGPGRDHILGQANQSALKLTHMTDSHAISAVDNDPEAPGATVNTRYYYTVGDKITDFVNQVNANPPHFVMHTGDTIDSGYVDLDFFLTKWGGLNPSIHQAIVPGNHDVQFTPPSGSTVHDELASQFGYTGNPLNASSKFNQSFAISGNGISARMIMLDTNIDPTTGLHAPNNMGFLSEAMKTWIETEINAAPEDIVLFASHHGPHNWSVSSLFDDNDAHDLQDIVDTAVASRPTLKIRGLFGHNHQRGIVKEYSNLGPNFPGYLAPALIELNPAYYTNFYIYENGNIIWETKSAQYPTP